MLSDGASGIAACLHEKLLSIDAVTVRNGRIVELDLLADPERHRLLDLTILDD